MKIREEIARGIRDGLNAILAALILIIITAICGVFASFFW